MQRVSQSIIKWHLHLSSTYDGPDKFAHLATSFIYPLNKSVTSSFYMPGRVPSFKGSIVTNTDTLFFFTEWGICQD